MLRPYTKHGKREPERLLNPQSKIQNPQFPMAKTLVTGAGGGLGTALLDVLRGGGDLAPAWPGPVEAVALSHADLDVADARAVRDRVRAERPALVINCAAFTDVDGCETKRGRAFAINAEGPGHLAAAAAEAGACLVQIGTDYIFDGRLGRPYREDDSPNPPCVYGLSKLEGEANARVRAHDLLLIRSARLFGPSGKNFVRAILKKAGETKRLELVTDQRGTPTYTPDLARAVVHLLRQGRRGLFHVANLGACNWLEWAQVIFDAAGLSRELVPVSAARFAAKAPRPPDASLDCAKLDATGFARRTWEEATRECVAALKRLGDGSVPGS
jgi:dTDP-4-dehydrorhamnose reductase